MNYGEGGRRQDRNFVRPPSLNETNHLKYMLINLVSTPGVALHTDLVASKSNFSVLGLRKIAPFGPLNRSSSCTSRNPGCHSHCESHSNREDAGTHFTGCNQDLAKLIGACPEIKPCQQPSVQQDGTKTYHRIDVARHQCCIECTYKV